MRVEKVSCYRRCGQEWLPVQSKESFGSVVRELNGCLLDKTPGVAKWLQSRSQKSPASTSPVPFGDLEWVPKRRLSQQSTTWALKDDPRIYPEDALQRMSLETSSRTELTVAGWSQTSPWKTITRTWVNSYNKRRLLGLFYVGETEGIVFSTCFAILQSP